MNVVILGLSVTSSWGNGHATNYRALMRELDQRGHHVTFLERDVPWYASNRDLPHPPYGATHLYESVRDLHLHADTVAAADLVIVGSYVPDGVTVGEWALSAATGLTAFYDIDTPITLRKLDEGDAEYLSPDLVRRYDIYLSFTGGRALEILHDRYRAPAPQAFYCFVDPEAYEPIAPEETYALNYLGTYSDDRQPKVESLLFEPARALADRRFAVAGPMYPDTIEWPPNVRHSDHLPPPEHPAFYRSAAFTLNVTRQDMCALGHAPSVRLFEAAACGAPVISDVWPGIDEVFTPGEEILLAESASDVVGYLNDVDAPARRSIADAARRKVLAEHTAAARVDLLEWLVRTHARGATQKVGETG